MWLVMLWTSFMNFNKFIFNYVLYMPKYVVNECLRWMVHVFFVNMICLKKRLVQFSKPDGLVVLVVLRKPDVLVCQTRLSGFDRQNICFSQFNFLWTTHHMHHVLLVHTHFCCTLQMHTYRGNSLRFPWKMCKMASLDQIWIPFNIHIFRGS
jgi:hypothetical protein